jgi:peptidoglycan/xylan/chitin deacetylase (PgdA/CDA1 family)
MPRLHRTLGCTIAVLCVAACAATTDGSADSEGSDGVGLGESQITATYTDGTGSYRYVDTHDDYAHTTTVNRDRFLYFRKVNGRRAVGLTMDCAWVEPQNAIDILDVYKRHNTKITFFISGPFIFKNIRLGLGGGFDRANFGVIKRMIDEGHEFGNHTQTHPHNNQSIDWVRENDELERGWDAAVAEIYRGQPIPANAKMKNYWRAPYGEYDRRSLGLAAKAGFPFHFGWNVDVKDAADFPSCASNPSNPRCLNPRKLTDTVLGFAERNQWSLDGFVILSHLQNPYLWGSDPAGLDRLLDTIEAKGHVVAKISEMFIESAVDPPPDPGTDPTRPAPVPGGSCAPGCIYSSFCVSHNPSAPHFQAEDGTPLVCVKSGECSTACTPSP